MCLVHHHQVPAGSQGVTAGGGVAGEKVQTAQHQLLGLERIGRGLIGVGGQFLVGGQGFGVVTGVVHNGETQVEATQHLHQPLVHQRFRYHYQHPPRPQGMELVVQNQPRLNGFTKPHLVRQQHPGRVALGHFVGDVDLVGEVLGAGADEPLYR